MPLSLFFLKLRSKKKKHHARFTLFLLTPNAPWLPIVPFIMLVGKFSVSLELSRVQIYFPEINQIIYTAGCATGLSIEAIIK